MEPKERDREDGVLIARVLAGDREAYAGLVRTYQARVRRLCASMLKDATEAEDAAQDVFLKAYRALAEYQGTSSFYTWLYRIASNHCLGLLRSKARKPAESWDALVEAEGEKNAGSAPDPRRAVEAADTVRALFEGLDPAYKLVLTLREMEGLSYDEIAVVMDCSLDSVKARLRRARLEIEEKARHFLPGKGV